MKKGTCSDNMENASNQTELQTEPDKSDTDLRDSFAQLIERGTH